MTSTASRDPWLRRFEKDTALACLAMAAAAFVLRRGNPDVALGVLGGGGLGAFSYWAIKGGVDAMLGAASEARIPEPTAPATPADGANGAVSTSAPGDAPSATGTPRRSGGRPLRVLEVAKFIGRYALLSVAAYVMLARLRLHPVGVLVGVSAPVVAAAVLVVRIAARRP